MCVGAGLCPARNMMRKRRGDAPQGYLFRFAPLRGHRPLRNGHRKTVCRGGALPRPLVFLSLFLFCLRRVTFFPWRKKVTKERHLRKGGFRFPPFLKNLFPLKRPKGRGGDPSPLETPPWGLGDYQIAPLPQSGKGRWRPLAAGGIKRGTDSHGRFAPSE